MAGVEVTILAKEVEAKLQAMQSATANMRPAWDAVGTNVVNRIRLGFRASRSPAGVPWLPLKVRQGQPLVDTGRLRRSITRQSDQQGVTIGTNLKYAPVHQYGAHIVPKTKPFLVFKTPSGYAKVKEVNVPARPFMPIGPTGGVQLPPTWAASVIRVLAAHLGVGTSEKVPA